MNAYELILFLFYIIGNAENIETTAKHAIGLYSFYEHILALETEKAKPLLLSHLLSVVLEMRHDNLNQKIEVFNAVHANISKVYDKDSLILTKMKI